MQIPVVKAGDVNTLQAGHALDLEELVDEAPALLGVLCGAFWCVAACFFLLAVWGRAAHATQLGDSRMPLWDQQAAPKRLVCCAWVACCCCGRTAACGLAEHIAELFV